VEYFLLPRCSVATRPLNSHVRSYERGFAMVSGMLTADYSLYPYLPTIVQTTCSNNLGPCVQSGMAVGQRLNL